MSSEDQSTTSDEPKSYDEILSQEVNEGLREFERSSVSLFLSAISAGLDLGFSALVVAAVLTLVTGVYGSPLTTLLVANAYTIGFIFVVLGRSELFTEHTSLAVLPVLDRQRSLSDLGRVWGIIYAGNIVGGIVFALFAVTIGPAFGIFDVAALGKIVAPFIEHSVKILFGAAVLAGWLMGLLSWLVSAARDSISRIFFVWLITFVIGFTHVPHSIVGHIEMFAALIAVSGVTLADYLQFMVVASVGNAIGGTVFVALLKYGHAMGGSDARIDADDEEQRSVSDEYDEDTS
jgi:formate/nitrite transporter FocA (FNT family)